MKKYSISKKEICRVNEKQIIRLIINYLMIDPMAFNSSTI